MNLPTLEELRKLRTDWLFDKDNVENVRNAIEATKALGDPIEISGRLFKKVNAGKWTFLYSLNAEAFSPVRQEYTKRQVFLIKDDRDRIWVRYIQIDGMLDTDQSHIVPDDDWKKEVAAMKEIVDASLARIKENEKLSEREALARKLLLL